MNVPSVYYTKYYCEYTQQILQFIYVADSAGEKGKGVRERAVDILVMRIICYHSFLLVYTAGC